MNNFATLIVTGLLLLFAVPASADDWVAPRPVEVKSGSGKYRLEISPSGWPSLRGQCKATLFQMSSGKQLEVWSRYLLNAAAPVNAYVSDDGRYVVTLDEWGQVGQLPVVIYNSWGDLISVQSLEVLGLKDDRHIERTRSSYWWDKDATVFFSLHQDTLFIRLAWGKTLMLDLFSGSEMTDVWQKKNYFICSLEAWNELKSYGNKRTAEISLKELQAKDSDMRRHGALLAGQLRLHQAIPRLRQLLQDESFSEQKVGDGPWQKIYTVRQASAAALTQLGVASGRVVFEETEKP